MNFVSPSGQITEYSDETEIYSFNCYDPNSQDLSGTGSIVADPLFIVPGTDFNLPQSSLCVGSGFNDDDMGAYPFLGVLTSSSSFANETKTINSQRSAQKKIIYTITPSETTFSETSDVTVHGIIDRIEVSATGTDTAFTLTLQDSDGINVFTKTDFSTASLPASYAVVHSDTSSNVFRGVPVGGALNFSGSSINPFNMTEIIMTVYYREGPE